MPVSAVDATNTAAVMLLKTEPDNRNKLQEVCTFSLSEKIIILFLKSCRKNEEDVI